MFRNFVDPPSLDRSSLNDSEKRSTKLANNLSRSNNANGNNGINGPHSDGSQVYYHQNSSGSSQSNGSQAGGYTTSIYVAGKSAYSRPPQQNQSNAQQNQSHSQQQQNNLQYQQQSHQYYNQVNPTQPIPQHQQNGHTHTSLNGQNNNRSGQFQPDFTARRGSARTDLLSVEHRMAATSINDTVYVNGNENGTFSSGIHQNHHPSSISAGADPSVQHQSFPNASYPSHAVVPTHGQLPQPAPTTGHALGAIRENGIYEEVAEDAFSSHQHQQQIYNHQQHYHHQQQQQAYAQQHYQQQPPSRFLPPTRPQQSWGSGWAPPPGASTMAPTPENGGPVHSLVPHHRIYNVVPPPPPLSDSIFAGRRDVKQPSSVQESQIVSEKGTVRGFKNRVRAGIATFWAQPQDPILEYKTPIEPIVVRNFRQLEQGKIVIYATSMSVVRETSERCKSVRHLLQNHMIRYEERDLYMSREIQQELEYRLKQEGVSELRLPHVFADGIHLGGSEELEKLNEAGELRALLNNYQKIVVRIMCERCGGYRFVPCHVCHGSKRSLLRNHFTEEFCALRCMHCNESGLKRCDLCKDQQE